MEGLPRTLPLVALFIQKVPSNRSSPSQHVRVRYWQPMMRWSKQRTSVYNWRRWTPDHVSMRFLQIKVPLLQSFAGGPRTKGVLPEKSLVTDRSQVTKVVPTEFQPGNLWSRFFRGAAKETVMSSVLPSDFYYYNSNPPDFSCHWGNRITAKIPPKIYDVIWTGLRILKL